MALSRLPAGIRHRPAPRQHNLGLTQLADVLFRLVLLLIS